VTTRSTISSSIRFDGRYPSLSPSQVPNTFKMTGTPVPSTVATCLVPFHPPPTILLLTATVIPPREILSLHPDDDISVKACTVYFTPAHNTMT
jgi:hypothetical protein